MVCFLIAYALAKRKPIILVKSRYLILLLLIEIFNIVPLLYSPGITYENTGMVAQVLGTLWTILIATYLYNEKGEILVCLKAYLLSGLFPIGFGFFQSYSKLVNDMLPSLPLPNFLVDSELSSSTMYNIYYRNSSTFLDPTFYGCYVITIFALLLMLAVYKVRLIKNAQVNRIVYLGASSLCVLAVANTLSLSAIIGMITILPIMVILSKKIRMRFVYPIALLIILLVISANIRINDKSLIDIIKYKADTQYDSMGIYFGRYEYIDNLLNKFKKNPLLGVGYGGLSLESGMFSSAHNALLTVLGQQGIIAFILYVMLLLYYPLKYRNRYSGGHQKFMMMLYAPILAMLIANMAYDVMFYLDSFYVLLGLFIGAAVKFENGDARSRINPRHPQSQ